MSEERYALAIKFARYCERRSTIQLGYDELLEQFKKEQDSNLGINKSLFQEKQETLNKLGIKPEPIDKVFDSLKEFTLNTMQANKEMLKTIGELESLLSSIREERDNILIANQDFARLTKQMEAEIEAIVAERDELKRENDELHKWTGNFLDQWSIASNDVQAYVEEEGQAVSHAIKKLFELKLKAPMGPSFDGVTSCEKCGGRLVELNGILFCEVCDKEFTP